MIKLLTFLILFLVFSAPAAASVILVNQASVSFTTSSPYTRNLKRWHDVNAIANASAAYRTDFGVLPVGITTVFQEISSFGANICAQLVPNYLQALPVDPLVNHGIPVVDCVSTYNTGYDVIKSSVGESVTVLAPLAELGTTISITK